MVSHGHGFALSHEELARRDTVVLLGSPNVGKSMLFYRLTGKYAWVSNYPGTTVEVSIGKLRVRDREVTVIDTPGLYSLSPLTEDERVARRVLFDINPRVVVHVVDAKNMERMLGLTLMLIEAGLNVVLVVNAVDEARKIGLNIDFRELERRLNIPVVPTVATTGEGVDKLREAILESLTRGPSGGRIFVFKGKVGEYVSRVESMLEAEYPFSRRAIAILALLGDEEVLQMIRDREPSGVGKVDKIKRLGVSSIEFNYIFEVEARRTVESILSSTVSYVPRRARVFSEKLSELMVEPFTGVPILFLSLFLLYLFVGVLGAQIVVDFLETDLFDGVINPAVNSFLEKYSPHPWVYELLGGEYGIITLGLKYSFSIILPVVSFFFIAFSIVEDTGYLPRLALLIDKLLKKIGLSGRAVIPLVLGTGCDTMATIVTRTLETKKERVLATLLLALGIPCSAQLGVIMGLLPNIASLVVWIIIVMLVMLSVAYIASKIIPGETSYFIIELPPLRLPRPENVLMKTWTRLEWYIKEVIPLFILASILIWAGRITGVFDVIVSAISIPTLWIGLPREAAVAFLYGFFRRDYGAAGFFDLKTSGVLNGRQILVAMVTITLFVPCIAQLMVMVKERGLRTALAIFFIIIPLAFITGYIVNTLALFMGF